MEATLQTIQDIVTVEDFDVSDCFQYSNSMESVKSTVSETFMSKPSIAKRRANQQETEQFYFTVRVLIHFKGAWIETVTPKGALEREFLSTVWKASFEYTRFKSGIPAHHLYT